MSDEYIRKADAVDRMNRYGSIWMEYTEGMGKHEVAEQALKASKQAVIDVLENLPSAEVVQVRHGKWIKEWWHGEGTRKCSACNITQTVNVYKGEVKFNYCPYCGARMDSNGEEEE